MEEGFVAKEVKSMKNEFLVSYGDLSGNDVVEEAVEMAEDRAKSYTLQQCFQVIQETSFGPDEVDIGLATYNPSSDWKSWFQQLVGFILSMELQEVAEIKTRM